MGTFGAGARRFALHSDCPVRPRTPHASQHFKTGKKEFLKKRIRHIVSGGGLACFLTDISCEKNLKLSEVPLYASASIRKFHPCLPAYAKEKSHPLSPPFRIAWGRANKHVFVFNISPKGRKAPALKRVVDSNKRRSAKVKSRIEEPGAHRIDRSPEQLPKRESSSVYLVKKEHTTVRRKGAQAIKAGKAVHQSFESRFLAKHLHVLPPPPQKGGPSAGNLGTERAMQTDLPLESIPPLHCAAFVALSSGLV